MNASCRTLCTASLLGAALAMATSIPTTPAFAASWECSAKNLKGYRYTGGRSAMIHLSRYPSGGSYPVRQAGNNKVTGRTKDGTAFTCVRK